MTTFVRTSIRHFSIANAIYAGATVYVYQVDANGNKTTTAATLYDAASGAGTLDNPQTLSSEGKWQQEVYIEEDYYLRVTGLSIADHDTGIFRPPLSEDDVAEALDAASRARRAAQVAQDLYRRVTALLPLSLASGGTGADHSGASTGSFFRKAAGASLEERTASQVVEDISALKQGTHQVNLPAGGWIPQVTNGCGNWTRDESSTNDVMTGYLPFDASSQEYAQTAFRLPKSANQSATITGTIEWKEAAGASAHDCVWTVEIQAQGDADTVDSSWSTAVSVTDTGTSGTRRFAEFSAVTPAGTPARSDKYLIRISRDAGNGSDNLDVDAHFIEMQINLTLNASDDS